MSRWPMVVALVMPPFLAYPTPSISQSDLRGEIASCSSLEPNAARLRCYDILAGQHKLGSPQIAEKSLTRTPFPRSRPTTDRSPDDDRKKPHWFRQLFGGSSARDPVRAAEVLDAAEVPRREASAQRRAYERLLAEQILQEELARRAYEEEKARISAELQVRHQPTEPRDPLVAILDNASSAPNGLNDTLSTDTNASALTSGERQHLLNQLSRCWRTPVQPPNPVIVRTSFDRGGRVTGARLLTGSGLRAELALRALEDIACQPFPLPPQKYEGWKQLDIAFDQRGLSLAALTTHALDLSTPEATLAGYINSLREGNSDGIQQRYIGGGFDLKQAIPIISYEIQEKQILDQQAVNAWQGVPPSEVGDVELQVRQINPDSDNIYSYLFRNVDGQWLMYSHAAWGFP